MSGRRKVSVTVDPDLLGEVDAYVQDNEGADRSKVFDDALRCWIAHRQKMALREQFSEPRSIEEEEELQKWRRIQAAQFPYLLRKYERHEEA
jgi:metal-responsive CopG/Arc/MetJ family transcriptional regulator